MSEIHADRRSREDVERQLDDALANTFPASDPVSFITSQTEEYWGGDEAPLNNPADAGERDDSGVKKPAA